MQTEQRQVSIELQGEVRVVTIERYSPDHCWFCRSHSVLCHFRTGNKTHRVSLPQVVERGGKFYFATQVVHNRHTSPTAWDNEAPVESKETSNW